MVDCHIIIAAPTYDDAQPVLASLAACDAKLRRLDVTVATGRNPPRQRNTAINNSQSKFILFLDSDCMVDANSLLAVSETMARDDADVAGGPLVLPEPSMRRERWFQAAVSHPAVVGKTASRYAARGIRRQTDERELILANLLVRRSVFEQAGLFNERLYPNEENEWMDRLGPDVRMIYDPDLAVRRPQRKTWGAFTTMLLRYGAGRVRQFFMDRRPNRKLAMPLPLLGWGVALAFFPLIIAMMSLLAALIYPLLLIISCPRHLRGTRNWGMIAVACVIVLTGYACGQLLGWIGWPWVRRGGESITLYDELGHDVLKES